MKKNKKPSLEMVMVYIAIKATPGQWSSVAQIAEISQVNATTTGRHLRHLADHGILDVIMTHPAYYYKLSSNAQKISLAQALERLAALFSR